MTNQDKGVVKRFIVTPDKHFPLHDKGAIGCLIKSIEIVQPDGYIDLGDVGEWAGASHWQWKKKKRPPLEYQLPHIWKDIADVNAGMDSIDEALDKVGCVDRFMCEGNHDDWLNKFVDEHPYLKHIRFAEAVRLDGRGYEYYPNGKLLKIGKLHFYHGNNYASIHHTRNHLMKYGGNIMYGHHHDIQQSSVTHVDGPKNAWSIGCMKSMINEKNAWLGHKPHNWAHAFAIVDFFDRGLFTVHVVQIVKGKTSLWGELIKA